MILEGIIFDFNGTLVRDSIFHDQAWNRMSMALRGRPLSDEEMKRAIHGWTNRDAIEFLLGRKSDPAETAALSAEKENFYRSLCVNDPSFSLAPGAADFLDRVAGEGIPCAIATSAGKDNIGFYFEKFPLAKWFTAKTVIFDDGTFPGKPDPEIYFMAARAIGIKPAMCAVFEDSPSGFIAAERAGAGKIIGVCSRDVPAFVRMCIDDFTELDPFAVLDGFM